MGFRLGREGRYCVPSPPLLRLPDRNTAGSGGLRTVTSAGPGPAGSPVTSCVFPRDTADGVDMDRHGPGRISPPVLDGHHARLEQVQAVEEAGAAWSCATGVPSETGGRELSCSAGRRTARLIRPGARASGGRRPVLV